MKKRGMIIGIAVLFTIGLCIYVFVGTGNNTEKENNQIYEEEEADIMLSEEVSPDSSYSVDEKIRLIIESEKYKESDIEERKEMAGQLLSELEKLGWIKNYHYDKDSKLYSFEYMDGSYGGIALEDFASPKLGMEYMN